jgi:lipoyl(octanoyl) transferase
MSELPGAVVRRLGRLDYLTAFAAMQAFTDARDATTLDELWVLEHPPVFTLGMNGKPEHLLAPGDIPVIQVDRGGQVTYHGPGQLVVYVLLDLRRTQRGVRQLVTLLEQSVVDLLAFYGIQGYARPEAPGVYVNQAKIAALGLRIRRGCSYHGLSLNVAMDLEPFQRINPCGYPGLQVTQLCELGIAADQLVIQERLVSLLLRRLGYTTLTTANTLPPLPTQEAGHA